MYVRAALSEVWQQTGGKWQNLGFGMLATSVCHGYRISGAYGDVEVDGMDDILNKTNYWSRDFDGCVEVAQVTWSLSRHLRYQPRYLPKGGIPISCRLSLIALKN